MTSKFFPTKIALITLVAACFVVNASMGVRQTFGLFSNNFESDCGISNTEFGLAVALHSLVWGIFTPIFGRFADQYGGSKVVILGLIAYAIGIPFYLFRDLIVRTYYILEKTTLPFQLSFAGILLNVCFDWALIGGPIKNGLKIFPFNFGVVGIVISSGIVNLIISTILLIRFNEIFELIGLYEIAFTILFLDFKS